MLTEYCKKSANDMKDFKYPNGDSFNNGITGVVFNACDVGACQIAFIACFSSLFFSDSVVLFNTGAFKYLLHAFKENALDSTISLGNQFGYADLAGHREVLEVVIKVALDEDLPVNPEFFRAFVNFRFLAAGRHNDKTAVAEAHTAIMTKPEYRAMMLEHPVEGQTFTVLKPFVAVNKSLFLHFYDLFPSP